METNKTTSHASTIAADISAAVVSGAAEIEARIRKELEEKFEAEKEERLQEAIDEHLKEFLPSRMRGDGNPFESAGGYFDLNEDPFFATQAQNLISDQWMPLAVQASQSSGQPSKGDIKRALEAFLLGAPLKEDFTSLTSDNSALLLQIMESCEQKAELDPHAVSIVSNITNYTVGTGLQFSCSVEEVEDTLRAFAKRNKLATRISNMVRNKTIFGEHYFFLFVDKATGDVYLRDRTKPYQIRAIKTHSEDAETRLAYGREKTQRSLSTGLKDKYDWLADINYFEQRKMPGGEGIKNIGRLTQRKLVQMIKRGPTSSVRGKPLLYPILRYLKYYEDFITDRIILNHERTKVVWIRTVKGNRGIQGGRAQRGPVGGQILTETPQIEWRIENAQIHASDVTEDGRLIRLAIAAAVGVPEHILFQDPSNQVYASIRSSDTPFAQNIRACQQACVDEIEELLRVQIREKVRAGLLPPQMGVEIFTMEAQDRLRQEVNDMLKDEVPREEIMQTVEALTDALPSKVIQVDTMDIPIDASFPDVVQQDPLDQARESEVLSRIGLFSKTELAQRHGGNYKQTAKLLNMERKWVEQEDVVDPDVDRNQGRGSYGATGRNDNDNPEADTDDRD